MDLAGFAGGEPRAPLVPLTAEATAQVRDALALYDPWSQSPSCDDIRTTAAWSGPEPGVGARHARDVGARAQPSRSRDDRDPRRPAAPARRGRSAPRDGAFSLAISGTGTAGMEAAVANITAPGTRVLVVVTGYFGDRLAQIFERYGATVTRVDVEWGRACDPAAVERALAAAPADIVAIVHAETSTGVLNPVQAIARSRRARCADGRRRGDVAWRDAARDRRVGDRRLLQLLAEGTGRAVRAWRRCRSRRARSRRK